MSVPLLLLIVLALGLAGFFAGRMRALSVAGGDLRNLHSLPGFYGWSVAILASAPAILVMVIWIAVQPIVIDRSVSAMIPETAISDGSTRDLVMADVRRIAEGLDQAVAAGALTPDGASNIRAGLSDVRGRLAEVGVALGANVSSESLRAAQSYRSGLAAGRLGMTAVVLALALGGLGYGLARITPRFRARNTVELAVRMGLILCSMIAIATTVGIVLSMVFETVNFFGQYPWQDFFFGIEWSPNFRGNSSLGVLPLLWGTMYVSAIALSVAVPVGLFSAIYLSEYAGPKFRAVVKPAIEVLAGIPTIVYGLFALITVGPLLRDYIAQPLGLGDSGSSVMTAGLVMGVMIIPFVSSLSDDIINAVPQSLRDGSLALGATNSETIRQVILPAALPGIVGAVLLAASRAIGETMIVVLGAGAAARMSLNPFEAMTTMTVKIVSQLTGDTDFAAPETLVAFALGLTLFVITLALNIVALWIVRTYREQYE